MKTIYLLLLTGVLLCQSLNDALAQPALKDLFKEDFLIGAALNQRQFSGATNVELNIIEKHFNTITAENALKWANLHPRLDDYVFAEADRFVEFGQKRGMVVIGHTLVWHTQTPRWVFQDAEGKPLGKDKLLARMRNHIQTVVGRYKGRIRGWDVVNEALNEDGTLRKSEWLRILGEDYLVKAFQFAREADPDAELYYNDYALEGERKRAGAVSLVRKLQSAGVKLTGVGLQGHYGIDRPSVPQIEETIQAFEKLGLKVMITELDVNVLPTPGPGGADVATRFASDPKWNPYTNGLPDEVSKRLADRYAQIFQVFLKHRSSITRVTFWGVSDRSSWLNHYPIRGRTNHPLLFDREGQPKAAFNALEELRRKLPGKD